MIIHCYCIFDRKALSYHPPYYAPTDGAAVRTLADAVADANNMLGRHPNDYVLYCVGSFDDSKGSMEPASPLRHVIDAIALVRAIQSEIPFPDHATTLKPSELDGKAGREQWVRDQGGNV